MPSSDDWIDNFLLHTESLNAPYLFCLWSAITTIAAAMSRRTWFTWISGARVHPNLYTFLISRPGSGKTRAVDAAEAILIRANSINISSHSLTQPIFLTEMLAGQKNVPGSVGFYSPLVGINDEISTLFKNFENDLHLTGMLSKIFDNGRSFKQTRVHSGPIEVEGPSLTLLVGGQPGVIQALIPENQWEQGLISRVVMVFAEANPAKPMMSATDDDNIDIASEAWITQSSKLIKYLSEEAYGRFKATPEVRASYDKWQVGGCLPYPSHPMLKDYIVRRKDKVIKLAMISGVSRQHKNLTYIPTSPNDIPRPKDLSFNQFDFDRALFWLEESEKTIPSLFSNMSAKNDQNVLEEFTTWFKKKISNGLDRDYLLEHEIYEFLNSRIPIEKHRSFLFTIQSSILTNAGKYPSEWRIRNVN